MERETALLDEFAAAEEGLLGTVRSRSWVELERKLGELRVLEERVREADRERAGALPEGASDSEAFARAMAEVGLEERMELERCYHSLSLAVLRVKGGISRIDHYVGSVAGSLSAVLQELLPFRKGRIYSARGRERAAADAPIVVNKRL